MAVGAGLIISGLAIYGFFAITGRVLSDEEFAPVSQVWFATFILAPGFFLPLEQEVGRALAHRRALGQGATARREARRACWRSDWPSWSTSACWP